MTAPNPNNNEFGAAEKELRLIGSNLWFGGLSEEWQDFLIRNTVEFFDNYEVTMHQAAQEMVGVYQKLVSVDPGILDLNPWETNLKIPGV